MNYEVRVEGGYGMDAAALFTMNVNATAYAHPGDVYIYILFVVSMGRTQYS
jgi:hypothetical protein